MGDVKENTKPTTEKTKSVFNRLLKGKEKKTLVESDEDIATSFVDHVCLAEEKLEKMIETKSKDLVNERGQETVNRKKLKLLEAMSAHHQIIVEMAKEYGELT